MLLEYMIEMRNILETAAIATVSYGAFLSGHQVFRHLYPESLECMYQRLTCTFLEVFAERTAVHAYMLCQHAETDVLLVITADVYLQLLDAVVCSFWIAEVPRHLVSVTQMDVCEQLQQ